jgi:hypothetical protein
MDASTVDDEEREAWRWPPAGVLKLLAELSQVNTSDIDS